MDNKTRGRGRGRGGRGGRGSSHRVQRGGRKRRLSKPSNVLWSATGPRSIDVLDFAMARAADLKELQKAAASTTGNRRVFQRLSWHRRRRTMSHTSYRMPKRFRSAHRRELVQDGKDPDSKLGVKGKMRCRKYRRRAKWLMALRRLRTIRKGEAGTWLETHIWHAKRFKMGEIWGGRKVGLWPVDRGVRSGWKATSRDCVAHDASYMDVVQLSTERDGFCLRKVLGRCLKGGLNGSEMAADVLQGRRMVDTIIYDTFYNRTVAPVSIMWRPNGKQAWLWVHPAAKQDVSSTLASADRECLVDIKLLVGKFCRFEIIGPRAINILLSVLTKVKSHNDGWQQLRCLRSTCCLPERRILSLEVEDPRAAFPPKKSQGATRKASMHTLRDIVSSERWTEDSRLWDAEELEKLAKNSKHTDGTPFQFVPVFCIQRPASLSGGFGSGWTIILPGSWGMSFWVSFMYATGSRAVGLREMRHIATESQQPFFPHDFPDTEASLKDSENREMQSIHQYKKRPRSKRVNYYLYRIRSPFRPDFESLFERQSDPTHMASGLPRDFSTSSLEYDEDWFAEGPPRKRKQIVLPSFGVIRGREEVLIATGLKQYVDQIATRTGKSASRKSRWVRKPNAPSRGFPLSPLHNASNLTRNWIRAGRALVRVTLHPMKKGHPMDNAIVCLPSEQDYEAQKKYDTAAESLREPLAKRNGDELPTRRVIGYVTAGTYSLNRGKGVATAFVTLAAAKCILRDSMEKRIQVREKWNAEHLMRTGLVLFRNTSSLQYRFAIATVLLD